MFIILYSLVGSVGGLQDIRPDFKSPANHFQQK